MGAMKDKAGPHGLTIVSDDSNIPICSVSIAYLARIKVSRDYC